MQRARKLETGFFRAHTKIAALALACALLSSHPLPASSGPLADRWQLQLSANVTSNSNAQRSASPLRAPSSQIHIPDWAWLAIIAIVGLGGFFAGWLFHKHRAQSEPNSTTNPRISPSSSDAMRHDAFDRHDPSGDASEETKIDTSQTPHRTSANDPRPGNAVPTALNDDVYSEAPAYLERSDGSRFALSAKRCTLGREQDNNVVLDDLSVSRHHAEIARDPNGDFSINDLNSLNGILVNGQKVDATDLSHGDRLEIGDLVLRFKLSKAPTPIAADLTNAPTDFDYQRTLVLNRGTDDTAEHERTMDIAASESGAETMPGLDLELVPETEQPDNTHQRTLVLRRPPNSDPDNI